MTGWLAGLGLFVYNARGHGLPGVTIVFVPIVNPCIEYAVEINPYLVQIKALTERTDVLRGYL